MNKFFKAAAVLSAATFVATCFAGCNSGDYTKDNTTFFLGGTGPLTGENSSYGISVKQGAELAVKVINDEFGGLNGIKFSFEMIDDKATEVDAKNGFNTLFEKGMQASIGSTTSGSCASFAAEASTNNVFFLTPSASNEAVIAQNNAFRVCFGDDQQGTLAAEELAGKYSNIGAIYDSSDTYSSDLFKAFKKKMGELGKTFKEQSFTSETNKDFSTQVEALKDCDAIFLPLYYEEASLIIKECGAKGCVSDIFGCDGFDGIDKMFSANDTVANSVRYITPFDAASTNEKVLAFVTKYKEAYNTVPDQFAADAYDAVMAIYEAMKSADVKDVNVSASDLCETLKKVFTSESFKYEGVTGDMTWNASGSCNKNAQIVTFTKK